MNHNIFFSKKLGFTLIELLVAIGIIALLTAIITANFSDARAKSRDAKRISDIGNIQLALAYYFDRCNTYPQTIFNNEIDTPYLCDVPLSRFISKVPKDPNGDAYRYFISYGSGGMVNDYILKAVLEKDSNIISDGWDTNIPSNYQACYSNGPGGLCGTCTILGGCTCGDNLSYCVKPN
jgi:prepilin-type N-terminal cleavage/methylation domain-containing protein